MMSEEKVINLANHLKNKRPLETSNVEASTFCLSKEKITLRRGMSFYIDFMAVLMFTNLSIGSYAVFVNEFLLPMNRIQKNLMIQGNTMMAMSVFSLIFITYFFYCNFFLEGRTIGSHFMKLRVVDEGFCFNNKQTHHHPSLKQSFRRTAAYAVCYMSFGLFFFLSLLAPDKRGLPERFSGTRVVSDEWLEGWKSFKEFDQEQLSIDIDSLDQAA